MPTPITTVAQAIAAGTAARLAANAAGVSPITGQPLPITLRGGSALPVLNTQPLTERMPATLTPAQVSAGYSTIPGPYDPVTGAYRPSTISSIPTAPTPEVIKAPPPGTYSSGSAYSPTTSQQPSYTGTSIVDYLASLGQASDLNSRTTLATQNGITGYAGTAEQNTQLLSVLQKKNQTPTTIQVPGASGPLSLPSNFQTYTPNDFKAQSIGNVIQMGTKEVGQLTSMGNLSNLATADKQTVLKMLSDLSSNLYEQSKALSTMPANQEISPSDDLLVSTSPLELQQAVKDNLSKTTLQMKDEIFAKYNIPTLMQGIQDMQNRIMAETTAYTQMEQAINEDPDLPKALAQRKLQVLNEAKTKNVDALKLQYQFLTDSFNQVLGMAKDDLGLYDQAKKDQLDQTQQDTTDKNNNMSKLTSLISNGAFTGATDVDLQSWADATGLPVAQIQSMIQNQSTQDIKYSSQYDSSTGVTTTYATDKNGKTSVTSQLKTGTPSSSGSDTQQKEIDNFYSEVDKIGNMIDAQKISWDDGWNRIHTQFPSASTELIDQTLGYDRRRQAGK